MYEDYLNGHHLVDQVHKVLDTIKDEPDPNDMLQILTMAMQRVIDGVPDDYQIAVAEAVVANLLGGVRTQLAFPRGTRWS